MSDLEFSYQNSKSTFVLDVQLLNRLSKQNGKFVFQGNGKNEHSNGISLAYQLYVSTPIIPESKLEQALRASDHRIIYANDLELSIKEGTLTLSWPIKNVLNSAAEPIRRPIDLNRKGIFDMRARALKQRLAEINAKSTSETRNDSSGQGPISLWIQAQIRSTDCSAMHVSTKYEDFENRRIVSGGRPETNPRKF